MYRCIGFAFESQTAACHTVTERIRVSTAVNVWTYARPTGIVAVSVDAPASVPKLFGKQSKGAPMLSGDPSAAQAALMRARTIKPSRTPRLPIDLESEG